ncbi:family 1 encapsulin nanocompartment shell protein [Halobacillus naozhouensis]|uniref:Type 1 encapsulin shell protein n=2 Tax=Halobacillus naozhouensis TaxID=554880 RepID=A0ABY8J3I8_9BACI|nr:family 1 encapsulin nanocompartment shell protein [Halobacillus naozhouensis]WFT77053.1 family 1 encapsulin nanocompartment shell protein [Halobacillus naozhouensis]
MNVASRKSGRSSPRGLLTQRQWSHLRETVTETVRDHIVASRFLDIYGPIGSGAQSISNPVYLEPKPASISMHGDEMDVAKPSQSNTLVIPILYKDFVIYWRDVEHARETGKPLDFSAAASAANDVALKEDDLIFNGAKSLNIPGLMNVSGRETLKCSDWSRQEGMAFQNIVDARNRLIKNGHTGPFAMALSPDAYARLHQVHGNSKVLEIEHVRNLFEDGIYQSSQIRNGCGVIVATGEQNVDIAIGQDVSISFLNDETMNSYFRVMECLVPRIKRPSAICTLENGNNQEEGNESNAGGKF